MSETKTIDLSSATTATKLHETLATALGFPDYYGGNWDAFWDFITEERRLPEALVLEGLDALEKRLPREARLLLEMLGSYNSECDNQKCAVEVSDSYDGPLYVVMLEAKPGPNAEDRSALGAAVNCWVKTDDPEEAERVARKEVADAGWVVAQIADVTEDGLDNYRVHDANRQYAKQACVDGIAVVFFTYDRDEESDPEDDFVTCEERRAKTDELLRSMGVAVNESLPYTEPEHDTELRSPADTAKRILCLLAVAGASQDVDRTMIRQWLMRERLWESCSPEEAAFLTAPEFDRDQAIQLGWRSEALWLLAWAIGSVEEFAAPTAQIDVDEILRVIPGFADSTRDFVESATMRTVEEVLAMSDFLYCAHWAIRNRRLEADCRVGDLISGVVMERHYAVNWLTRYGNAEWDEVTCDT